MSEPVALPESAGSTRGTALGVLRPVPPTRGGAAELSADPAEEPPDPGANSEPDPGESPRRTRVFAHRGASGLFPEHTRAAYVRAIEEGADGLEIDLHLTADGEPVCFHDATVDRTSNGTGAVAELSLAQMRSMDVTSWKTPSLPGQYGRRHEQVMTLADVLELLTEAGRDMSLAVELKHPSPYGDLLETKVLRTLMRFGWDPETSTIPAGGLGQHAVTVSFMSFYPGSLLYLAEMVAPDKLCALLGQITEVQVQKRLARMPLATALRPMVVAVMRGTLRDAEAMVWNGEAGIAGPGLNYVKAHSTDVKAWLARGSRVRVWTVDQPADAQLLTEMGVQEITTNFPARILDTVTQKV